jgi:putative FmdB family regulatory protein
MPIYEYHCPACREDFELLIRGADQPACPECGTKRVEKLLSVPAAHSHSSKSLPICEAPVSSCGLPQCGGGTCGFDT